MSAQENLKIVQDHILKTKEASVNAADHVDLIAVSKTHDKDKIRPVIEAGQRIFGENRVQESYGKWPDLKAEFDDIELHLIGPLQSNKTAEAMALFDVIQTVDREKIAKAIAKEAEAIGKCPKLFIQVNTGHEEQKAGIDPEKAIEFIQFCRDELKLPIIGLMCIPPAQDNPGTHFALLKKIAHDTGLAYLSMGMSQDYELAVEFGATHVRVGSAIFGERLQT